MITFGEIRSKEREEYDKLAEYEILQRLIKFAYLYYKLYMPSSFDVSDETYSVKPTDTKKEYYERCYKHVEVCDIDDYALADMNEFLDEYPYMRCIPFGILYELQRTCNADELSAGWCGCFEPRYMLYVLENVSRGELW